MFNRTYPVRERMAEATAGVAFISVHSPSGGKGAAGSNGARAGNGKYAILSCIGIWRQVSTAAVR